MTLKESTLRTGKVDLSILAIDIFPYILAYMDYCKTSFTDTYMKPAISKNDGIFVILVIKCVGTKVKLVILCVELKMAGYFVTKIEH